MLANNQNPFIVDLQYALQTELCAILVLGLVGGGDLSDLIHSSKERMLPENLAKVRGAKARSEGASRWGWLIVQERCEYYFITAMTLTPILPYSPPRCTPSKLPQR